MRDIGVRLARQKLLRYRMPEPTGRRWWRLLWVGVAVWAVYALLLSSHSVRHLLNLQAKRDRAKVELAQSRQELERARRFVPDEEPTREQAEGLLYDRLGYARQGEWIYIIGEESTDGHPAGKLSTQDITVQGPTAPSSPERKSSARPPKAKSR